ncbi:MAG: RCC1 domain-containing protein [Proteobacteria bacterium]|nr:RCC1 domain-containing protein [Pseudomonadota bacterium]
MNYLFLVSVVFFTSNASAEYCESRDGFQDTPNGCKHRGLVWSAPSDAPMTATQAAEYCAAKPKIQEATTSWRLPPLDEFRTFADSGALSIVIGVDNEQLYWTASKKNNLPQAYFKASDNSLGVEDVSVTLATFCVIQKVASQISAGGNHTFALDEDGVKCWGSNNEKAVGKTDLFLSNARTSLPVYSLTIGRFFIRSAKNCQISLHLKLPI